MTPTRRTRRSRHARTVIPHGLFMAILLSFLMIRCLFSVLLVPGILENEERTNGHALRHPSQNNLADHGQAIDKASTSERLVSDPRDQAHFGFLPNERRTKEASDQAVVEPLPVPSNDRFIVFQYVNGQGAGNNAAGLLAAHLLGIEFNRTVCIHPKFESFRSAFQPANAETVDLCQSDYNMWIRPEDPEAYVRILNYATMPNECEVRRRLSNKATKYVYMLANAYPQWPSNIPRQFFDRLYMPSDALRSILPWTKSESIKVVVHLRMPDGSHDKRNGLDDESLHDLGEHLSSVFPPPYLVTNRVAWYELFETRYGWKHPGWNEVHHSGFRTNQISWGSIDHDTIPNETLSGLQMWADWYAMIRAQQVYHTWSDFSASAIHWNGADGRVIEGHGDHGLNVVPEPWKGAHMLPLRDRQLGDCSVKKRR